VRGVLADTTSLVASVAEAVHLHGTYGVEFLPAATVSLRSHSPTRTPCYTRLLTISIKRGIPMTRALPVADALLLQTGDLVQAVS